MDSLRESFLRAAFSRLNAQSVPYCVSRNADEIYSSNTSDIDLVVPSGSVSDAEAILNRVAEACGYRLIARIEFTNLCLAYWAPGADFIRIDLDSELRWFIFEIADAETLLEETVFRDGIHVISPLSEWFVMADRLAWRGSLPPRYKTRVAQLFENRVGFSNPAVTGIIEFLTSDDSGGFRRHLLQRTLSTPHHGRQAVTHACRDTMRLIRRLCSPPGLLIQVKGGADGLEWNRLFQVMSMAFPEAKCVRLGRSPLPGLLGLFRGGLVIAERGHPFTTWICALFAKECHSFRVIDGTDAPSPSTGDLVFSKEEDDPVTRFADLLAAAIANAVRA